MQFELNDQPEKETLLQEAQRLVHGPRAAAYGNPLKSFTKVAKYWSVLFGVEIQPEQVPMAMALLKMVREMTVPKRDNRTDICGYMETLELTIEEKERIKSQLGETALKFAEEKKIL